jgi:hypothetical protein
MRRLLRPPRRSHHGTGKRAAACRSRAFVAPDQQALGDVVCLERPNNPVVSVPLGAPPDEGAVVACAFCFFTSRSLTERYLLHTFVRGLKLGSRWA